jgi:hypothetical protein
MFGKKREKQEEKKSVAEAEKFRQQQREGAALYKRVAELQRLERAAVPEAAMLLLKDARHQVALIRQSIADRSGYNFRGGQDLPEGDLATSLAEDIAGVMRENITNPQTFFQAMSDQLPDVHFTVSWEDACTMVAAEIREERILGIIEGLQLAGLIQRDRL